MSGAINRAQFLRGDFSGERAPLRPPWAMEEALFTDLCGRCGDCLSACPEKIISAPSRGFPQVDFSRGECTFCGACAQRCSTGALRYGAQQPAWNYKANIGEECLARRDVVCVTCAEQCEAGAIHFTPRVGAPALPHIDISACNGCGACYRPCPAWAIKIRAAIRQPSDPQHLQLPVSEAMR